MTTRAVLRSLVVLIFVLCTGDAVAQTLPKDPCALLKPAEIQALAPNAKIGSGVPSTQPPLGVSCQYAWGPRTPAWGETTLSISVVDASKVYPGGLSANDIKQRVLVMVKTGGPNASEIPGIGDGAVFTFETSKRTTAKGEVLTTGDAKTTAFVVKAKGVILDVTLHDGSDALAQKDKLIALLKAAAAAL
jgi:hypothetical protein